MPRAKAKEQFNVWLDPLDIVVYIDGSQKEDKSGTPTGVGAALVIKSLSQWLGKGGIPLGSRAEGYDSEAIALCKRFETTPAIPETRGAPGIHICLDNLSVAREAGSVPNGSSQSTFERFRKCAKWWLKSGKRLTVQWIPGHAGILGNEIADIRPNKQPSFSDSVEPDKTNPEPKRRKLD